MLQEPRAKELDSHKLKVAGALGRRGRPEGEGGGKGAVAVAVHNRDGGRGCVGRDLRGRRRQDVWLVGVRDLEVAELHIRRGYL